MAMLTDSGLETWLMFHKGVDLPSFAAFPLLDSMRGRELLAEYFRDHLRVAERSHADMVLETPTWRASSEWGAQLGYGAEDLDRVNKASVAFVRDLGAEFPRVRLTVSGLLGPRGDAYDASDVQSADSAMTYHLPQIESFAAGGADRIAILTVTHSSEAIGVVRAATAVGLPVVVSFTVETDGRLPSGQTMHEAIAEVDAATDAAAVHYGINCAHPDHFGPALDIEDAAIIRVELVRANASRASHEELDNATELDAGDPDELATDYARLLRKHVQLSVLGGCCGTDVRHIEAIARACITTA